jgi:hypothetical protein
VLDKLAQDVRSVEIELARKKHRGDAQ